MARNNRLPPVHPGEIIKEDILPSVGQIGGRPHPCENQ